MCDFSALRIIHGKIKADEKYYFLRRLGVYSIHKGKLKVHTVKDLQIIFSMSGDVSNDVFNINCNMAFFDEIVALLENTIFFVDVEN